MRGSRFAALALAAALAAGPVLPAFAVQPDEILQDPALEKRARDISSGLRCLVCQNQSIDDSDAPLARDLRLLVRDKLKEGASDSQIRDFLVARYGEFVLLKPSFTPHTLLLWLGPFAVLVLGAGVVWANSRRRPPAAPAPLTPEEQAALEKLAGKG